MIVSQEDILEQLELQLKSYNRVFISVVFLKMPIGMLHNVVNVNEYVIFQESMRCHLTMYLFVIYLMCRALISWDLFLNLMVMNTYL